MHQHPGRLAGLDGFGIKFTNSAGKLRAVDIAEPDQPLSCRTTVSPAPSPVTLPPTVKLAVAQVTATFVTFALAMPEPIVTVQVCLGAVGCVRTVTA